MPSQKSSDRRRHRDRQDERKRDRINGEEKRRHRDEDTDRRHARHRDDDDAGVKLTEDEREKQREERRRRREGGKDSSSSKDTKGKEIQFRGRADHKDIELNDVNEVDSDDRPRKHRSDRDRERRPDDDREKHRRHPDDDNDREKHRRHRDEDEKENRRKRHDEDDEDEREQRRLERRREREDREEEERRKRHEEKKDRRRDDDRKKDRDRHRDRDEERSNRHRDRKDWDHHRGSEQEREERKEREREERRREREEPKGREHRRETEQEREERKEREREERRREREERHKDDKKSSRRKQEEEQKEEEEEDDYNYEEDFEDYEEDFEEDEEDEVEESARPARGRNIQDSEVNEVLRALDAENERLLNSSSKSPQPTWRRQTDDVDQDQDSDEGYQQTYQPRAERPRTAINFVSAKQRAVNRKTATKTMQRGKDLLRMIELDYASFDIMDLPPVNEYDMYIRAFGSSNTRQAYVQTNDDNIDRDIQTEEVDARNKWTQHPPEDFKGYGRGDGEKDVEDEEESQSKQNREQDLSKLNKFLEKAGQVIAILLEEGKDQETGSRGKSQAHISVSEGYTRLDILPLLQGRYVTFTHFCPVQPNLLLTLYSQAPQILEENPVSKRGVICVWNTNEPNYPQKILVCSSQPRCCCFSPVKPYLVFAGLMDGSIAMWDLREPASIHQTMVVNEESWSLRYPTYDTASVLKEENHHSPVMSLLPIYSYVDVSKSETQQSQASEDTSSGLSFQLVSTEESAVLNFWVVAEIGRPELAGSESDLGLAPGAAVKLLKSSTLTVSNHSKDAKLQSGVRALDMALMPNDPNHFYVATDGGSVLHGIRFGKRTFPRAHNPVVESIVDVVSIDFSPFDQPCFLAGCSDGTFSLYHTKSEHPVITWPHITKGRPIQCVRWSRSRPCVFYVLDVSSTLFVFDLLEGDVQPKSMETIAKLKVTSFSLTTDQRPDGLGASGKDAQMLFSFEDGRTEIHTITKSLRVPEQLEADYLGSYLQRF